jgi:glutamate dehydrogenase (NAD(P)+)
MTTPVIKLEYTDPVEGIRGYLVIDRLVDGFAAGGLRIHQDVTVDEVADLARNMTAKLGTMRIQCGGAKAGIAMDPRSPRRREVLTRFLAHVRPFLLECWSVGPDVNTTMAELEEIGRTLDIPAMKIAVARRHGFTDDEFLARYGLFESRLPLGTVNELRGPTAVVAAARAVFDALGPAGPRRVAIQGAGNMGWPSARLLVAAGASVVAWADADKCLFAEEGLPVDELAAAISGGRLPTPKGAMAAPAAVITAECDVLILAAVSHAFGPEHVGELRTKGIVLAANMALSADTQRACHRAGILVVPDVVASTGGSLAVEALYRTTPRGAQDILDHIQKRIAGIVPDLLEESRRTGVAPIDVLAERARG